MLITVTDETFASDVLSAPTPVVVDFWATWCPSCVRLAPILDELATEFGSRMVVAKIDADANPAAVRAYGVQALPALLVFRGGSVVGSLVGARPKAALRQALTTFATP
jgi:thioredoxin 1